MHGGRPAIRMNRTPRPATHAPIPRRPVPIVVQCPHGERKLNLNRDMIGKSVRCPNLDCRLGFIVAEQPEPIEPPKSEPVPVPPARPAASAPPAAYPFP